MEFQDRVTMSISNWTEYINDDDIEFAFGNADFLSNRPNSHKHIYSEEVIKEYAPTVLGKWVVAEYNKYTSDATTHTDNEVIVGYVPISQEVKYRYDADGYLIANVDIIISKIYATDVYEMFKRKNYKSVSIEELVNFTEETKNIIDGVEEKIIESFNICGITILGDKYNPSVPNANIQLTKMSENNIDLENIYVNYSEKHMDKIDIVLSKLESIERKLNKEENMENQLNPSEEQVVIENACAEENACEDKVDNAEVVDNESVENAEAEVEENACGEDEKEVDNAEAETVENEEVEKPSDEEEDIEDKDENKEDDEKDTVENVAMAELQSKLDEAEAKIASYESEIAELKSFKESVQNAEKNDIANQTLNKVKDFITEEEYSEYQKQFKECEYSEIGALKNSILAKYVDNIIEMSQKNENTEIVDYAIPISTNKVDSIYD